MNIDNELNFCKCNLGKLLCPFYSEPNKHYHINPVNLKNTEFIVTIFQQIHKYEPIIKITKIQNVVFESDIIINNMDDIKAVLKKNIEKFND